MTSSPPAVLVGSQRPTLLHLPEGDPGAGLEACDLAKEVGIVLDDWQRFVIVNALLERPNHQWAATEIGVEVARQNGKNVIQEVIELAALLLFGEELVSHSAHLFPTATEHFIRMRGHVENNRLLAEQVDDIYTANGKEAIIFKGGRRLKFFARARGGGRGFTGDRMVFDEAFSLDASAVGAMIPALSARSMETPGPQIMYFSSPAHSTSAVLHSVRQRARDGNARLAYFGWLNEPGTDRNDREAWYRVNPGLGVRIAEEFVETELAALADMGDEFDRERLGIPSEPDMTAGVFPPGVWQACTDEDSQIVGRATVALDVAPGMTFSSFAVAGKRADGLTHGELAERYPGTDWVLERAKHYSDTYGPLRVDPKSPVGGLIADLERAGVKVSPISDADLTRACAALQEKVLKGTFRHLGAAKQPPLSAAAHGAAIRPVGDAWRWSRSNSRVDISPLVAVTIAAAEEPKGPTKYWSVEELWSDA